MRLRMLWGYYGCGIGFGWLMLAAFWVLIIVGIFILIRWSAGSGKHSAGKEYAIDILRKRYARGEIDSEEFERIKKDITGN